MMGNEGRQTMGSKGVESFEDQVCQGILCVTSKGAEDPALFQFTNVFLLAFLVLFAPMPPGICSPDPLYSFCPSIATVVQMCLWTKISGQVSWEIRQ